MNINNSDNSFFIKNLARTCQQEGVITSNGKSRSFLSKLLDFFRKRKASSDFLLVCQSIRTLTAKDIKIISKKEQVQILRRIQQVAKKLEITQKKQDHTTIKDHTTITEAIETLEDLIFANENIKEGHKTFFLYLHELYAYNTPSDQRGITEAIKKYQILLRKDPENTHDALEALDSFLEQAVFHNSLLLCEKESATLEVLHPLFALCNEHINKAKPELKLRLKIKFANLPSVVERSAYQNLILTKTDQLEALVEHFTTQEKTLVTSFTNTMAQKRYSTSSQGREIIKDQQIHQLVKMVCNESRLEDTQREKLRQRLLKISGETTLPWESTELVEKKLKKTRIFINPTTLLALKRTLKAKDFFKQQLTLQDDEILIPRWFHSTSKDALQGICKKRSIEVRHKKILSGAWVSTTLEKNFGNHVLSFTEDLDKIDPMPRIHFEPEKRRWRGIQKTIPLKKEEKKYLSCIAIPSSPAQPSQNRERKKEAKAELQKQSLANTAVFSSEQLLFIRENLLTCLGTPNLTPSWWAKPENQLFPDRQQLTQYALENFNPSKDLYLEVRYLQGQPYLGLTHPRKYFLTKLIRKLFMRIGFHAASMKTVANYLKQHEDELAILDENKTHQLKEKLIKYEKNHKMQFTFFSKLFGPTDKRRTHQETVQSLVTRAPIPEYEGTATNPQKRLSTLLQNNVLPVYKLPMPQTATRKSESTASQRTTLSTQSDRAYTAHSRKVEKQQIPARAHHGTMHAVRVTLWTQVLAQVYKLHGEGEVEDPVLLGLTGAFHDTAREAEGKDYWDEESSEAFEHFLKHMGLDDKQRAPYVHAVKEKDPPDHAFKTPTQRILHDADCLDIIRVVGVFFNPKYLLFSKFKKIESFDTDKFIEEAKQFIKLTEKIELRTTFEHESQDFYGDLLRFFFKVQKEQHLFPIITSLLNADPNMNVYQEEAENDVVLKTYNQCFKTK